MSAVLPASAVRSFAPIEAADARLLVLGSMPGVASLRAGRYYAHPRNTFWPILGELIGAPADWPDWDYARRATALKAAGIAVWDVLAQCQREGSLDARIERRSEVANDITGFVAGHPRLAAIALNGRAAEAAYRRHMSCSVAALRPAISIVALPSTSPAHAARSYAQKRAEWEVLRRWL